MLILKGFKDMPAESLTVEFWMQSTGGLLFTPARQLARSRPQLAAHRRQTPPPPTLPTDTCRLGVPFSYAKQGSTYEQAGK